jgi:hypothetical protein
VGAGITGGAIFALTAWLALAGMWVGAGLADRFVDAPARALAAHAHNHGHGHGHRGVAP